MQKESIHARIVMSPQELAALRLDVHLRRRSLGVNMIICGTRHGPRCIELVATMRLRSRERAAVADIVTALGKGERWTDATTRRLGAALAPIRRRLHRVDADADADPDDETGIAWHLARLDELARQFQALRQRKDMLAPATTRRRRRRAARPAQPALAPRGGSDNGTVARRMTVGVLTSIPRGLRSARHGDTLPTVMR